MRNLAVFIWLSLSLFALDMKELKSDIKTKNIDGNFTQTKILSGFPNAFKSYGNFTLKEDELLWSTLSPINTNVVINEKGIFELRDKELINIGRNFDKRMFLSIIKLDEDELEKEFDIRISALEKGWNIELKPKNVLFKQIFSHILIFGDKFVERIELFEVSGDKTINEFYDVR